MISAARQGAGRRAGRRRRRVAQHRPIPRRVFTPWLASRIVYPPSWRLIKRTGFYRGVPGRRRRGPCHPPNGKRNSLPFDRHTTCISGMARSQAVRHDHPCNLLKRSNIFRFSGPKRKYDNVTGTASWSQLLSHLHRPVRDGRPILTHKKRMRKFTISSFAGFQNKNIQE